MFHSPKAGKLKRVGAQGRNARGEIGCRCRITARYRRVGSIAGTWPPTADRPSLGRQFRCCGYYGRGISPRGGVERAAIGLLDKIAIGGTDSQLGFRCQRRRWPACGQSNQRQKLHKRYEVSGFGFHVSGENLARPSGLTSPFRKGGFLGGFKRGWQSPPGPAKGGIPSV